MLAEYSALADRLLGSARAATPVLTGFNACVDAVYQVGRSELDALAEQRNVPLAGDILDRVSAGQGGEIFTGWPAGPQWMEYVLGVPRRFQVGGTGPQASWALAELGARSTVALADRSRDQLSVLHPAVRVCEDGEVVPIGCCQAGGEPTKPRHYILEFTAGTRFAEGVVARSTRIIVRFAEDGLERDTEFEGMVGELVAESGSGLVSGLNGLAPEDTASRQWLRSLVARWRALGLPTIHLELAEYTRPAQLAELCGEYGGLAHSVGMSLSELRMLAESDRSPGELARQLANYYDFDRVCVHADEWALTVHRGDAEQERTAVVAGNLLASARARHGTPTADLVPDGATFTDDHPSSGPLPGGWRVECVPAPYWHRPTSTVGLGDTFVAGTLLALGLGRTSPPRGESTPR